MKLRLPAHWVGSSIETQLQDEFGYEDMGLTHDWRRFSKMLKQDDRAIASGGRRPWIVEKEGREALEARVAELDTARSKTALFRDAGGLYTYSGLGPRLAKQFDETIERAYTLPSFGKVAWKTQPFPPRWYQSSFVDLAIPKVHAAAELATGLGKSLVAAMAFQRIGLPGIVVAPTLSIAEQLLTDLRRYFGEAAVGQFFDGKKQSDRMFVVAVSKSLVKVVRGTQAYKDLSSKQVLIGDESHLLPAETLSRVVLGMLGRIPYRFFLSGTQLRPDGLDLLLEGIISETVISMDVRQGVSEGFLTQPRFCQFSIRSDRNYDSPDSIKMNRVHLHDNDAVYNHAAWLLKGALRLNRRPLVLVAEVPQFMRLLKPMLKTIGSGLKVGFCHGGVDVKQKKLLHSSFWKSDTGALVESFDAGNLDVLVGTGCIGVGTDIKSASFGIDLVGLTSEIRLRQYAGRFTRLFPGKKDFFYNDYDIRNVDTLHRHAVKRAKILDAIYGPVKFVRS